MPVITVHLNAVDDATTEGMVRGHHVLIDRPHEKGGHDQGAMGGELLLLSLGGCFNSNLLAAIKARELPIDDITITINGTLEGTPPHYTDVDMVISSAYEDRETLEKVVMIAERSCIVANTLKDAVNLSISVKSIAQA